MFVLFLGDFKLLITSDQLISGAVALFSGGGAGWVIVKTLIKDEAIKANRPDIEVLTKRLEKVEDDYVTCKYCNMMHKNLDDTLKSIDDKLDILINKV